MTSGCRPKGWRAPRSNLAVYQAPAAPQAQPTRGSFVFRIGNAQVTPSSFPRRRASTSMRRPRNCLPACSRRSAHRAVQADYYADRIIGWRTLRPRTIPERGRQLPHRRPPVRPARCTVSARRELALVLGIPELMVERALPYPHGLQWPAAGQYFQRGAAGSRRPARNGPARLNAILVQRAAAAEQRPRHCWRCSALHRRSRTQGTRRCG